MIRLLQSGWMTMLAGAIAYLATTILLLNPAKIGKPNAHPAGPAQRVTGASWEFFDPEVDRLIEELGQAKLALAEREQQLEQLTRRLTAERAELCQVTQAVHQLRLEFDRNFLRIQAEESANLKRLAKTYAAMSPEVASSILSQMEDDQLARLLQTMKESEAAAFIEYIAKQGGDQTKRAAALAERLRKTVTDDAPQKP